ncbi:hypothetical protein J3R30DRAFT_1427467 [Lentinula aciculospora]|uniref:Uncharacterized protein n=1 Tax=Lentinula aciculospora TaxID=153920 RepID=A0A9W9AMH7_9AGAR|nr:hypothetical protein J3R30DRAFT_1427467 [Lentinula aciculospora]
MTSTSTSMQHLLGRKPSSQPIVDHLNELSFAVKYSGTLIPDIKSYPDVVYYNFHHLGLSLLFKPTDGYKPRIGSIRSELTEDKLVLESIDIYNVLRVSTSDVKGSQKRTETAFAAYPISPVFLNVPPIEEEGISPPHSIQITRGSTGKDFVQDLGEPDRKGGGSGPSSGSIGIWCEWKKHGVLVEFGGVEAIGPQAWERGKDAVWRVVTIFMPMGQE